jgi:hypothetical protein
MLFLKFGCNFFAVACKKIAVACKKIAVASQKIAVACNFFAVNGFAGFNIFRARVSPRTHPFGELQLLITATAISL